MSIRILSLRTAAVALAALALLPRPQANAQQITSGTRVPTESEQYSLQLINRDRASANGLVILQRFVTNNLANITASSTGTSGTGTPWKANFWTSNIAGLADNMNAYKVHPGDLKKQFQDLVIPNYPLAWNLNLGNVASGYNQIIITNAGAGPGFPHQLAPYQDVSTFAAYAKRYTDGGYGPVNDINELGENVAPNNPPSALFRHAAFMIDFGPTANGIQDQSAGSHRTEIMSRTLTEIGISSRAGWTSGNTTEDEEFGHRFSRHVSLTGVIYRDADGDGFYTGTGEGFGGAVVTATLSTTGAVFQTTSYSPSGGYALELNTAGTYRVRVGGRFQTIDLGNITIGDVNVQRDVIIPPGKVQTDFNNDYLPDIVFQNTSTGATEIRFLNGSTQIGSTAGITIPAGWQLAGVGDFNHDNQPDYVLFNPSNGQTSIRYASRGVQTGSATGPTLASGSVIAAIADFDGDGQQDFLFFNAGLHATSIRYLNGVTITRSTSGPSVPAGFIVVGAADFNRDGIPDVMMFNPSTNACQIAYLSSSGAVTSVGSGPAAPAGWTIAGPLSINADNKPDVLLYNSSTGATSFWILDGVNFVSSTRGPIAPSGWTLVAP